MVEGYQEKDSDGAKSIRRTVTGLEIMVGGTLKKMMTYGGKKKV